jgi:hypothetical protein
VGSRLEDVELVDAGVTDFEQVVASASVQQAIAPARWFRGWVEIRRGRAASGLALVREGFELYTQVGTSAGCTETLYYIVEAQLDEGRFDEAQSTLDEAMAIVQRFGERIYEPELLLLQARTHAGRGDSARARRAMETARDVARELGAPASELKALVALAEEPNASAADLAALRAARARFTEGFDAPACVRASELLAERG